MKNDKTTYQLVNDLEAGVSLIEPRPAWKLLGYSLRMPSNINNICRDFIPGNQATCLFSGENSTNKILAAELIAKELKLKLYRIDLSVVVSEYIGETEKNLGRIFDRAKDSGCILFFDEADALFGKRTQVSDTHDRFANTETGYLLQRIGEYSGIAILATNQNDNLDKGFVQRIQFVVKFSPLVRKRRKSVVKFLERVRKGRARHLKS